MWGAVSRFENELKDRKDLAVETAPKKTQGRPTPT